MSKNRTSHQRILRTALELSSERGVSNVTFGELAKHSSMSKSGLFAHFTSSDALRMELLDVAEAALVEAVLVPCADVPSGLPRLRAVVDRWLGWAQTAGLSGGCPLYAAAFEVDDTPGPLRDHLAGRHEAWVEQLVGLVLDAVSERHLPADTDAEQVVRELEGIYLAHHVAQRLTADPSADDRARRSLDVLLHPDTAPRKVRT